MRRIIALLIMLCCTLLKIVKSTKPAASVSVATAANLNAAQSTAVFSALNLPVLCKAGPGSGKTKVLTHRIEHLIKDHDVNPASILALTFTNKAGNEMKSRLNTLLGPEITGKLFVGTFHGFSSRLLRTLGSPYVGTLANVDDNFSIYDQGDSMRIIKSFLKGKEVDNLKPLILLTYINKLREAEVMKNSRAAAEGEYSKLFNMYNDDIKKAKSILPEYEEALRTSNAIDFEGLLLNAYRLLKEEEEPRELALQRWRHILVDEYQDTNILQYEMVRILAPAHSLPSIRDELNVNDSEKDTHDKRSLFVVGDKNQAIYSWRGARPSNMDTLQRDYSNLNTYGLLENYRCTFPITAVANAILGSKGTDPMNQNRKADPVRLVKCFNGQDQAQFIGEVLGTLRTQGRSIGIMYRRNAESRVLEEEMIGRGISYKLLGGRKFYDRREIRDFICFLRLLANPDDKEALLRVMGDPAKGIGDKTRQDFFTAIENKRASFSSMSTPSLLAQLLAFSKSSVSQEEGNDDTLIDTSTFTASQQKMLSSFSQKVLRLQKIAYESDLPTLVDAIRELFLDDEYLTKISRHSSEEDDKRDNILELMENTIAYAWPKSNDDSDSSSSSSSDEGSFISREGAIPSGSLRKFLEKSSLMTEAYDDDDLDDMQRKQDGQPIENSVYLLTIHASKGLEFDTVFVTGFEENSIPLIRSYEKSDHYSYSHDNKWSNEMLEERRLAFVAVTRAQKLLFLLSRKKAFSYSKEGLGSTDTRISRFLTPVIALAKANSGGPKSTRSNSLIQTVSTAAFKKSFSKKSRG